MTIMKIFRIPHENHKNNENPRVPYGNYENHENLKPTREKHENHENLRIPLRFTKCISIL